MAKHTIDVVITDTGDIESTVKGVDGPECGKLSAWLDKLGVVEVDEKTKDYYKKAKQTTRLRAGR